MADPAPLRIALAAPDGKMGRAIALAIAEDPAFDIDQDNPDVLVDFSAPAALPQSLERAVAAKVPVLIGTTGLGADADALIADAAKSIPVLRSANTSLGVALLADLVERAAKVLGRGWDIEIAEAHHRFKADAPSGTALMLGEAAAKGRGSTLAAERGRDGTGLAREEGAIGFASLRGGTVAGDHEHGAELRACRLEQLEPVFLGPRHGELVRLDRALLPWLCFHGGDHRAPPELCPMEREDLLVDVQHGRIIALQVALCLPIAQQGGDALVALLTALRQLQVDGVVRAPLGEGALLGIRDNVVGGCEEAIERAGAGAVAEAAEGQELGHAELPPFRRAV